MVWLGQPGNKKTHLGSGSSGSAQDVGVLNLLAQSRATRKVTGGFHMLSHLAREPGGSDLRERHCGLVKEDVLSRATKQCGE